MLPILYHDKLVKDPKCRILANLIRRKAEMLPDKRVLTFTNNGSEDTEVTYKDLEEKSNQFARALKDRNVQLGDKVIVLMDNLPEVLYILIACSKMGVIFIPIDPKVVKIGKKLLYLLRHSQSKAIFVSGNYYPDFMKLYKLNYEALTELREIFIVPTPLQQDFVISDGLDIRNWTNQSVSRFDVSIKDEKALLTIFYTSGTTGMPKGVLWDNARYTSFGMFPKFLGYNPEDPSYRIFTGLPLFHSNAHGITLMYSIWNNFEAVINRKWSLTNLWPLTRKYNIRSFCTIGNMALEIYRHSIHEDYVPNPVEHIVDGGLPGYLWKEFTEKFGLKIWEAYSQVEGGATFINPPSGLIEGHIQKSGSIGKPGIGWEVDILNERNNSCPCAILDPGGKVVNYEDAVGEIVSRKLGFAVSAVHYLNDEHASFKKTEGGWHHSGDYGYKDKDGYSYITHRTGETIRRAGKFFDIFDLELVQKVILEDPSIFFAHIFPAESQQKVVTECDMVAAIVPYPKQSIDLKRLVEICRRKLPSALYYPNWFLIFDEMPKTSTEKTQNNELRKLFKLNDSRIYAFSDFI